MDHAKTGEGGETKQGRQEKGTSVSARSLLGHRPAGMPVEPIETRIDKTSGECDHREIASSVGRDVHSFFRPCVSTWEIVVPNYARAGIGV